MLSVSQPLPPHPHRVFLPVVPLTDRALPWACVEIGACRWIILQAAAPPLPLLCLGDRACESNISSGALLRTCHGNLSAYFPSDEDCNGRGHGRGITS